MRAADTATAGKASETVNHLVDTGKAALSLDFERAAAAGSFSQGAANVVDALAKDALTDGLATQAVEEGEPPLEASDFGRGALRDVVDVSAPPVEEPVVDLAVENPDRLEYEPALESEPAVALYESSDLVARLDGSVIESTPADPDPDLLDSGALGSDFDLG